MSEYKLGYLIEEEDHDFLSEQEDPEVILRAAKAANPSFNPYLFPHTPVENQYSIGSCAGNALALMFQIALVQRYGVQARFSRMGCYIMAQKASGISGDRGSTLSGCQKAAADGMCLEKYWPYPNPARYSNQVPSSSNGEMVFKMSGSRQIKDVDLIWDLLKSGVPIQTGLSWGSSCEKSVCNTYSGGRGGHSTSLVSLQEGTDYAYMQNSWGANWGDDGRVLWTKNFVSEVLRKDRYAVFTAYDPQIFEAPEGFIDRV